MEELLSELNIPYEPTPYHLLFNWPTHHCSPPGPQGPRPGGGQASGKSQREKLGCICEGEGGQSRNGGLKE